MADKSSEGAEGTLSEFLDLVRPFTQLNGRVTLPGAFVKAKNISYGQPILVEVAAKGVYETYLCSATVAATSSNELRFDPSLLCGLVASRQLDQEQQQLVCSVRPITRDIIIAATLKVLVPQQLLLSTVPAAKLQQRLIQRHCTLFLDSVVCCQVLDVTPAAPAGSVYRVVPSTHIQLTADSGKAVSRGKLQPSDQNTAVTTPPGPTSSSVISTNRPSSASSSSSSKKKKKIASKSSQGATAKAAGNTESASKGQSKSRRAADDDSEPPAVASGSMFDLLEGLDDL